MSQKTQIVSGDGNYIPAKVSADGALHTVAHNHPPIDEGVNEFPFRAYFRNSAGSNDMRVNGATTNVDFCIQAQSDRDIWIKSISVIIGDNGAKLNLFGAKSALTNGVEFSWSTTAGGKRILHEGIKTNLAFVRLGVDTPPVGGTDAFKADLSGAGGDSYLPWIDINKTFGMLHGLRLRKGTKDKVCFTVRDNLSTGLDQFDIIAYGKEYEY